MSEIVAADITDGVISQFTLTSYLTEADNELYDLAESFGVYDTDDIETDPLHYKVKRYLVAFVCMRVAQDKSGVNNTETPDIEKYRIKYLDYKREVDKLRSQISQPMITGNVDQIKDRAIGFGSIFRG